MLIISNNAQLVLIGNTSATIYGVDYDGYTIPYGVLWNGVEVLGFDSIEIKKDSSIRILDYTSATYSNNWTTDAVFETINGRAPYDYVSRMVYSRTRGNIRRSLGILSATKNEKFSFGRFEGTMYKETEIVANKRFFTYMPETQVSINIARTMNGYFEVNFPERPSGYYYIEGVGIIEFVDPSTISKPVPENPQPSTPSPNTQSYITAAPTAAQVIVNGRRVDFCAYNIAGSNYFMLRDLAYSLTDTKAQFDVGWDNVNKIITMTRNKAYTPVGGEMAAAGTVQKPATLTSSTVLLDGSPIKLTAYNIGGNNYFMLREIAQILGIGMEWNEEAKTIFITTETNNNNLVNTMPKEVPNVVSYGVENALAVLYKNGFTSADVQFEEKEGVASGVVLRQESFPDGICLYVSAWRGANPGFIYFVNSKNISDGTLEIDSTRFVNFDDIDAPISIYEGMHRIIVKGSNIAPYSIDVLVASGKTTFIDLSETMPK